MESLITTIIILTTISVFVSVFVLVNERESFELDAKELNDAGFDIRLNNYLEDAVCEHLKVNSEYFPKVNSEYFPKVNSKHFPKVNLEKIFN